MFRKSILAIAAASAMLITFSLTLASMSAYQTGTINAAYAMRA
jgi:hypothetical protein